MNLALASHRLGIHLPGTHGWAGSLVLHGAALGLALVLMRAPAPPEVMRWEVSLAPPAPAETAPSPRPAPVQALTPPTPERLAPPAQPEPTRTVAAEPAPPPAPAPQPVPLPPPNQVTESAPQTRLATTTNPPPALTSVFAPAALVAVPPPAPATEKPVAQTRPAAPADAEAQRRWYAALAAKLAELKRYPLIARRQGQEGVVVLEARFQGDGHAAARIKRSSGHASLDRAAVKLFEEAMAALDNRLAPPDASALEIPVAYRLEG